MIKKEIEKDRDTEQKRRVRLKKRKKEKERVCSMQIYKNTKDKRGGGEATSPKTIK